MSERFSSKKERQWLYSVAVTLNWRHFYSGRLSSVSSSSSTRGGRQNLDELEGRMELGIELGEEIEEEEAQLSPVYRSEYLNFVGDVSFSLSFRGRKSRFS